MAGRPKMVPGGGADAGSAFGGLRHKHARGGAVLRPGGGCEFSPCAGTDRAARADRRPHAPTPAPTDAPTPEPEPEQPALSGADAILVWVPVHGGTKYHSDPGCSNMKDPRQVTQQQAMAEGFAPCKKCYG